MLMLTHKRTRRVLKNYVEPLVMIAYRHVRGAAIIHSFFVIVLVFLCHDCTPATLFRHPFMVS